MKRTKTQGGFPKKKKFTPAKASMYKQIRTAIGVERKYFDLAIGFNVPSAANWGLTHAIANDFPEIPAGDDNYQRNGKKVLLQKLVFRGRITMTPVTAQGTVSGAVGVRVVLIANKKTNAGGASNVSGVEVFGTIADGSTPANAQIAVATFQYPGYFGKYQVLKDKTYNIQPASAVNNAAAGTVSANWNETWFKMTYKFPGSGQVLDYLGTGAATPVNIGFNVLANADTTTGTPSLQGYIRAYYTDA